MASSSIPFVRGQNVILRLYQQNKPIYVACKTHDIEENATEVVDDVGGENRSRLDKVTNYFTLSLDVFQADQEVIKSYMTAQDADDAAILPLIQNAALLIKNRDGTRAAFVLQEAKIGPMKLSMGGRDDAFMLNLKIRFRFFTPVPSI